MKAMKSLNLKLTMNNIQFGEANSKRAAFKATGKTCDHNLENLKSII